MAHFDRPWREQELGLGGILPIYLSSQATLRFMSALSRLGQRCNLRGDSGVNISPMPMKIAGIIWRPHGTRHALVPGRVADATQM